MTAKAYERSLETGRGAYSEHRKPLPALLAAQAELTLAPLFELKGLSFLSQTLTLPLRVGNRKWLDHALEMLGQ
jgi:hypothetical protein